MELDKYISDPTVSLAKSSLNDALVRNETPEQVATRLSDAKRFGVTAATADTLTPEEKAAKTVAEIDWAAMRRRAPVLLNYLANPDFVGLVKDDLGNQTVMQSLIFRLSPDTYGEQPTGFWGKVRNAGARSLASACTHRTRPPR